MIGYASVGGDNCSVKIDIGRVKILEQVACIGDIVETKGAEANELEGVEVSVGMAERNEMGLELPEMIEAAAPIEDR